MTHHIDPFSAGRQDVSFTSQGSRCHGWLTYPGAGTGRVPLVIMAHGFAGTRELRLEQYAERFHAAGFATLIFDYRHFGASEGHPRQLMVPARQIQDWHAALAFARDLPGIDTERLALWGTSFAGGLVITVAAQDGRVAATVSQCPMLDGVAAITGLIRYAGLGNLARVLWHGVRDAAHAGVGAEPHYIPAVAAPGEVGAMTSEEAMAAFHRMGDEDLPDIRVTARSSLLVPLYRPIRDARKVRCPALLQLCDHDTVAPAAAGERAAKRMSRAEVVRYPVGHFDVYFDEAFEASVSDQVEFLRRHLGE
ncbi:MAG: alpha/beta fold hydrolase [Alcanivoracaceae bacterium]|nr:alpha/beta fold hydrolase [Alcanivoracaceae bacterium]